MQYKSSKSVFDQTMDFVTETTSNKKKNIDKQSVIDFLNDLYKDKQTVQVNIGARPIKFEGLNEEQVECFLKIFEGYKENLEQSSKLGKIVRHQDTVINNNGFEDVTSASAEKITMIPTPPVN